MNAGPTFGTARSIETALVKLRGIRKARVDIDRQGDVSIEVLAVPERSEAALEKLVRDVASLLLPEKATVKTAVLMAARGGTRGAPTPRRKLSSLITRRTQERLSTQVILSRGGDVATGESECHPQHHPERSVAQAVIDGLYDVSDRPVDLVAVETVSLGDTTLAVVSLAFGTRRLVGAAEVRFDLADAIARATLHALNRSISYAR
jgi:hypothetical protein